MLRMSNLSKIYRLGLRSLRRNPMLTALMVVTLAVGVAWSMATFTVLYVMTVVDLSRLEVELEIPESYAADDLGLGMSAEVNIGTTRAMGKLSALSPEVVRNQVMARVRFDGQRSAGLRQNQRLTACVLIEEKADVLMRPRGSFVEVVIAGTDAFQGAERVSVNK